MPGASTLFLYLLPQRMVELGAVGLRRIPLVRFAPPLDIDAIGVALKQTARALDDVDPAVGAWEVRVVADADGSPVGRLDQAHVHVA